MLPSLFDLGPVHLYSYGVLIALGGVLSSFFWKNRSAKMGIRKEEDYWLLINVILVCGFLGGRLLFLAEYVRPFSREFWRTAFSVNRGFSVMGAFVGVTLGVFWFSRRIKAPFIHVLDYICQIAPFWHFFGRLGCFMAGCCFGRPTDAPWAVVFRDPTSMIAREAPELVGVPVHPTQLYEAFGNLAIAAFLYFVLLPSKERGALPSGVMAGGYFLLYAALRFIEEYYRGDTVPFGFGITTAQAFCLGLAVLGLSVLAVAGRGSCTRS